MKRREFLSKVLVGGGSLVLANTIVGTSCRSASQPDEGIAIGEDGFVAEPQRRIPILEETDVLVVGGGPAGVAAAIAAAREGVPFGALQPPRRVVDGWIGVAPVVYARVR